MAELLKVILLVDDLDATLELIDAVGAGPVLHFNPTPDQTARGLGWPADHGGSRGVFVGERPGLLEIVEIPEALRGIVAPGVGKVTFTTADVEGVAAQLEERGRHVRGPIRFSDPDGGDYTLAQVALGGVLFEVQHVTK
jgi:hypothetical protein